MAIPSPRASAAGRARDVVPIDWHDPDEHRRKIAEGANLALQGKSLNTGTVTLTANVAQTTLIDERIGTASTIPLVATTANAAAEKGNGTIYVTNKGKGVATIFHANNAQTDRTFDYAVIG